MPDGVVEAVLRDVHPDDAAAVLALNNACAPALSTVDLERMRWFLEACPYFRIVAVDERREPRAGDPAVAQGETRGANATASGGASGGAANAQDTGDGRRAPDDGRTHAEGAITDPPPEHSNLAGFLVAMTPDVDYRSGNFRWFVDRGEDFVYIDRIAVSSWFRRRGIAERLYADIERWARARDAVRLTCEVNVRPRNEPSLAFHERMGFVGLEERETENGPRVLMMEKPL